MPEGEKVTPIHVAALLEAMLEGGIEEGALEVLRGRRVEVDLHGLSEHELRRREREEGPVYLALVDGEHPAIEIRIDYENRDDRPPRREPTI